MIKKYHNHTLQTNAQQRAEEPENIYSNNTSVRQNMQCNQLSLPHQDVCKPRMDTK